MEAANVFGEGFPAGLPSYDLTDDFLDDVTHFLDTSLYDTKVETPGDPYLAEAPTFDFADQPGLAARHADYGAAAPDPSFPSVDLTSAERRMQSNRLAQARARQRRKVPSCGSTPDMSCALFAYAYPHLYPSHVLL